MSDSITNWAGNIAFGAARLERPQRRAELQEIVRRAGKVRALGSGHSFNRLADTDGTLISLAQMERVVDIDPAARTITIDGGATYAHFAARLHAAGFALANAASLPHITVAGAVATATHGSGDGNRNLSAAVAAVELVTASGEIVRYRRGDADFDGVVVGLGALGVVSALTLDIVPAFDIRQNVYLDLKLPALLENFEAVMARAYSVSLFTRWRGDAVDQAWVKARAEAGEPAAELLGARGAAAPCHPIPGMDGADCTPQMGVAGPWHERLFHFPIGHQASAGAELQSELFVRRTDAPAAIQALHAAQEHFADALFISEIRSVAADELWLSMAHGQDSIGFHFTWKPDWEPTLAGVRAVEAALAPFQPRPHWAKVFTLPPADIRGRYPRYADFRALAGRLDPEGKFRNTMVQDLLFA